MRLPRLKQCCWTVIWIVCSAMARLDADRIYHTTCDPSNPLWRQDRFHTGERRGPRIENCFPPRLPGSGRRNDPSDTLYCATIQGGQQQQQSTEFREDPSALQMLGRWMKQRSKRGTITIDLVHPEEDTPKLEAKDGGNASNGTSTTSAAHDANSAVTSNGTSAATKTIYKVSNQLFCHSELPKARHHPNVQISISVNPPSMFRLTQNAVKVSVAFVGAFGGTLRLLAPMIVARRILSTVGYICYDYYNGRYIRTTYNRHSRMVQQYEIPSALRACCRMGLQLISMAIVGSITRMILHGAPCFLPAVACRYWFGSVWVGTVLLASLSINFWVSSRLWHSICRK